MKKGVLRNLLVVILMLVASFIAISLTNVSNAANETGRWNISKDDGQSNVTAILYDDGRFVITGTGEIKDYESGSDREYAEIKTEVKSAEVGQGITNLGKSTFKGFYNVETVSLPDGLKTIGNGAFYECNKLKEIKLPDSVESIGANAFGYCKKIKTIKIPYGIEKIDYNCFYGCFDLEKIEIPNTVTEIKGSAFKECALKNIYFPYGLEKIGSNVFENCKSLEELEIPYSVKEIGNNAFKNCKKLKIINMPNSVKRIGSNAFEKCISIEELTFPKNLSEVGENIFLDAKIKLSVKNDAEYKNVEMPEEIKNYIISNPNSYELINCELNDNHTIRINTQLFGDKIIKINSGLFNGLKIITTVKAVNGNLPEFYGTTNITLKIRDELDLQNSYYRIFAKDFEDGNITKNIQIISNNVNTTRVGNYQIKYEITDSDNNKIYAIVPVQVISNGDRKIQRTLYTLPDATLLNNSSFGRGNNHDVQDLGIYLPANKSFQVKQLNTNGEPVYVHLYNDDALKENTHSSVIYNISQEVVQDIGPVTYTAEELENVPEDKIDNNTGTVAESAMYNVRSTDSKTELQGDYSNISSNVTIEYKANYKDDQEYSNWDKYSSKSYDSIPMIKTLYGVDEKPVIEVIINTDTKSLDYFTYGDDTQNFIDKWTRSQNSLAIIEGERTTFLVPRKDLNDLCKSKKDKNIMQSDGQNKYRYDNFSKVDDILSYYDNVVKTYDSWIGLSDSPENSYNQNIKSKYFVKANIHGTGAMAYASWNYTYCTTDTLDTYLHKSGDAWGPFHEFGHGYQGFLKNKELYLGEISNNFFAYYFQKNDMPGEDWIKDLLNDPEKIERMINTIRDEDFYEENQGSVLEDKPTDKDRKNIAEGVSRYEARFFAYINLLNKINYQNVLPYTYEYCRKLESEGKKDSMTATDIIAKCFSEASGYNVIPYLEDWKLTVSENVKKEIYSKNYPIIYYLNDLVTTEATKNNIKTSLGLSNNYSLISNNDIDNYNLKGNIVLSLDSTELNKLSGSNIILKFGNEVVGTANVNNNTLEFSNIPVGTYEIETSKEGYEIKTRYVYVTENTTNTVNVKSENIRLERIEIEEIPNNTINIYKGEELDLSGLKVKAIYSDGTFEYIDNYNVSGFYSEQVGNQIITITYQEKTATFSINVLENKIEGITILNPANKVNYIEEEDFESEGLVVAVVYTNGETEIVEDYTLDQNHNLRATQVGVLIQYQTDGESLFIVHNITVREKQLTDIVVKKAQDKQEFIEGDNFDANGMIISAVYDNGKEKEVDNYEIENGTDLRMQGEEGTVNASVTIRYTENNVTKSKNHGIRVIRKKVDSIEVKEDTITKIYRKGTELDLEDGKLLVTYNNSDTEEIDLTAEGVEVTGYDNTSVGEQTITVTYQEKETTFNISVIARWLVATRITTPPNITEYIEGETFNPEGMDVLAVYDDGLERTTDNYEVVNGSNLSMPEYEGLNNSSVSIEYTENGVTKGTLQRITVRSKSVINIEINEDTIPKTYVKGSDLDLSEGKMTVYYDNNQNEEIDLTAEGVEISGYDKTQLGEQTVTVTYKENEATFNVTVKNDVVSILAKTENVDKTFIWGSELDLTNGLLEVTYENGEIEEIDIESNGIQVSGYDETQLGEQTLTVRYKGKTDTFNVIVVSKKLRELRITTPPTKTEYIEEESFNPEGMVVVAVYSDNSEEITDNYVIEDGDSVTIKDNDPTENSSVTIKYTENGVTKSVLQKIFVREKRAVEISVKEETIKTSYVKGTQLDLENSILEVTYDNNKTEEISLTTEGIEISGYDETQLGEQTITVRYKELETSFNITVRNELSYISVKEGTVDSTYVVGTELDLTNGVLELVYEDGEKEEIRLTSEEVEVSGYDKTRLGEQVVTVRCRQKSTTFNVVVVEKKLTEIRITTPPTKTEYIEEEAFDPEGMVVVAVYNDESEKTITNYRIIGGESVAIQSNDETENSSVTIKYTENGSTKSVVQRITVRTKSVIEIRVKDETIQKVYLKGAELNLTGGILEVRYNNNKTEEISLTSEGIEISGYDGTQLGEQTITVRYNGKETTFNITVRNEIASMSVKEGTVATTYIKGTDMDLTQGILEVRYENGETEEVSLTSEEVEVSGYDKTRVGEQTITVRYKGNETSFMILVKNAVTGLAIQEGTIKTIYIKGSEIDLTQGTLLVTYENGETEEIGLDREGIQINGYNKNQIGYQTVEIRYFEGIVTYEVFVKNEAISISMKKNPNKTTYHKNEDLDLTGGKITVGYENGEAIDLDLNSEQISVRGYRKDRVGEQQIIVSYRNCETTFNVIVKNDAVEVRLISAPTKTVYIKGEELNLEGGTIEVVFEDGDIIEESLSNTTITGFNSNTIGTQTITADYQGIKITFQITVKNDVLSITMEKNPNKTTYYKGDNFDKTGGKIRVVYENGETEIIGLENVEVETKGYNSNMAGEQTITVRYKGKETSFVIRVVSELERIEIKQAPSKTEYVEGDNFDKTGMVVEAVYGDGTRREITDYRLEDNEDLKSEQESVKIIYSENGKTLTISQKITVYEKFYVKAKNYDLKEVEGVKYLKYIDPNTSRKTLNEEIHTNGTIKIFADNKEITNDEEKIGTGTKVTIEYADQRIEYIAVVTGDLTGDGKMGIVDLLKLSRYISKMDNNLKEEIIEAADVYKDGNCANIVDLLRMSRVLANLEEM